MNFLLSDTFLPQWSELARLALAYILMRFVLTFREWDEKNLQRRAKKVDEDFNPVKTGHGGRTTKTRKYVWILVEALTFGGLGFLLLGRYNSDQALGIPVLVIGYFLIELLKQWLTSKWDTKYHIWAFLIELVLYTGLILVVWQSGISNSGEIFQNGFEAMSDPKATMIVLGYFLVWFPTGYFMSLVTISWQRQLGVPKGLKNAGRWIGILERTLVFTFILNSNIQAIGLLIAAKSVLRFGEIKDHQNRKEAEYILIGTLLSFSIAIVLGLWIKAVMEGGHFFISATGS